MTLATELRKSLHVVGILPPNTRFIKLRYDLDGTFDGVQFETLGMSRHEIHEVRKNSEQKAKA